MHIHIDLTQLNWLALVLASAAAFVLGGIWYGPLFSKPWLAAFGFSEEQINQRHPGKIFGQAIIWTFLSAVMLAFFIEADADLHLGAMTGFFIGLGFVTTFMGIHYAFEGRGVEILLINTGYSTLALTLMGAIIGWF